MRCTWATCSRAQLDGQEHLGALIADFVGLRGIEAMKVEAACGSGAAALRVGVMAVASGMHDLVLVCGVEKMTDAIGECDHGALATAADQEYEVSQGVSFVGLNALLDAALHVRVRRHQGAVCGLHRQRAPQRRQQPERHVPEPGQRGGLRQRRHDRRSDQPAGFEPGLRRRGVRRAGPGRSLPQPGQGAHPGLGRRDRQPGDPRPPRSAGPGRRP